MDIPTAIMVHEDAVKRSQTENVNTAEVLDALDFFAAAQWSPGRSSTFANLLRPETASSILIQRAGGRR
jgi:hypothetical protein